MDELCSSGGNFCSDLQISSALVLNKVKTTICHYQLQFTTFTPLSTPFYPLLLSLSLEEQQNSRSPKSIYIFFYQLLFLFMALTYAQLYDKTDFPHFFYYHWGNQCCSGKRNAQPCKFLSLELVGNAVYIKVV